MLFSQKNLSCQIIKISQFFKVVFFINLFVLTEAATRGVLSEKVFLEISQKDFARVSFPIKLHAEAYYRQFN